MVPTCGGLMDQTTVPVLFVTVAVKDWAWPEVKVAVAGEMVTLVTAGAVRVIFAVPVTVESVVLVAVTVTVCDDVIGAGAV